MFLKLVFTLLILISTTAAAVQLGSQSVLVVDNRTGKVR
jgi:hypothetical protein